MNVKLTKPHILLLTDNESDKHIFYALREVLRRSHYPPPPSIGVINDPRDPPLFKFIELESAMKIIIIVHIIP